MNSDRFDFLIRAIGKTTSRRLAIHAVAGSALSLVAGRLDPGAAAHAAGRRCRQGKKRCGDRCVDTATNRNHCGRCDRRCRGGQRCHAGTCLPDCEAVLEAAGCQRDDAGEWRCGGANLDGAILTGCDLSPAMFERADLSGAALSGANLSGDVVAASDLRGADLDGADLTGVTWRETTCPDGADSDAVGGTCCRHLNGAVPAAGC